MAVTHGTGRVVRLPLLLEPQPEGGYSVTSPLVPELITCIETLADLGETIADAWEAVTELYEDTGRQLPGALFVDADGAPLSVEVVMPARGIESLRGECPHNASWNSVGGVEDHTASG